MDPPNGCAPLPNSQHLPCILLLSKDGWLYQYTLEDATCLNKVFIPTKFFSDFSSTGTSGIHNREEGTRRTKDRISSLVFSYQYIDLFDVVQSQILITSAYNSAGQSFKAYLILGLFPFRIVHHFVTVSRNRSLNIQLWSDMMVLTIKTGSLMSLYGLQVWDGAGNSAFGQAVFCKYAVVLYHFLSFITKTNWARALSL